MARYSHNMSIQDQLPDPPAPPLASNRTQPAHTTYGANPSQPPQLMARNLPQIEHPSAASCRIYTAALPAMAHGRPIQPIAPTPPTLPCCSPAMACLLAVLEHAHTPPPPLSPAAHQPWHAASHNGGTPLPPSLAAAHRPWHAASHEFRTRGRSHAATSGCRMGHPSTSAMPLKDRRQGCPPMQAALEARDWCPRCRASNLPSATITSWQPAGQREGEEGGREGG